MTQDLYFDGKKSAFQWYREQGGRLKRASFYEKIPWTDGGQVATFSVSELLRNERPSSTNAEAYSQRMMELDLEKKELEVKKLGRAEDHVKELERQVADHRQQQAALLLYTYHTVKYHLSKSPVEVLAALGLDPSRAVEVSTIIENYLDRGMNEIAHNKQHLTIEIDDATGSDNAA